MKQTLLKIDSSGLGTSSQDHAALMPVRLGDIPNLGPPTYRSDLCPTTNETMVLKSKLGSGLIKGFIVTQVT